MPRIFEIRIPPNVRPMNFSFRNLNRRRILYLCFSGWVTAGFTFFAEESRADTGGDPALKKARQLQREVPLIDGHNDFPWQVMRYADKDLSRRDMAERLEETHTDLPRLREGQVGGQFWVVYPAWRLSEKEALSFSMESFDVIFRMLDRYPDDLELALKADDAKRIFADGKIASFIGVEGGRSIDNSLGVLRVFYRLGARYMTLTHNAHTAWADSSAGEPVHGGLTGFGRDVVREMNRLGMMVDLSHTSADTMRDAMEVTESPVIFSHSNARALCDVPRNVPDDVLDRLRENNGLIMVTFVPGFLSQELVDHREKVRRKRRELRERHPDDRDRAERELRAWRDENPAPRATLSQVADHIDYIVARIGIDHVGIGSDYDGISQLPAGLEDVSRFVHLTAELVRRDYAEEEIKKILGLNLIRVLRQNEEIARELRGEE